jgi:hypothetical protein
MITQLNGLKIVFEVNISQKADFNEDYVSNLVVSGLNETMYEINVKNVKVKLKDPIPKYKPYNFTDLNREGMQSRDECRKIMALQRANLRVEI